MTTDGMTAPKRRWFRFSLRTLFVVATLLGCWLGWYRHNEQKKQEALAFLESLHVRKVIRQYSLHTVTAMPIGPIFDGPRDQDSITLIHGRFTDSDLHCLARYFPEAKVYVESGDGSLSPARSESR